ncbi:MAG: gliding motility protein GldM [Bacteroidales bacterium]
MAGGKQTPRQKLIGLMYLIFLALMALNVSVEVLDSFALVNDGIEQTNRNFKNKVEQVYADFRTQQAISAEKVQPYYGQALRIQELADSLVDHILHGRNQMIAEINEITVEEADTLDLLNMKKKDNYSFSSSFWMIENSEDPTRPGGKGTRAYDLRQHIESFKGSVLDILEDHDLDDYVQLGLDVEGPFYMQDRTAEISWQQLMFDRVIPVAVATNLSRLVTEVRNAEFDAINLLYGAITAQDYKFDEIAARVVPNSQIVLLGESYEAEVFVAAYDSRQSPEITASRGSVTVAEGGMGKLRIPATSEGPQTYSGVITLRQPGTNTPVSYPYEGSFIVQRPSVTISADAMNVFYIGLDNPASISVPGVPNDRIKPTISAGGQLIARGSGKYDVRLQPGTNEVRITVNADVDGTTRNMGTSVFRVKTVPDPVAYIANRREGRISKEELVVARGIIPRMENFEFDMNFEIASFTMATTIAGDFRPFRAESNLFTPEMINVINNATRGQRFIFESIVTKPGPDGRVRNLSPITFTIN